MTYDIGIFPDLMPLGAIVGRLDISVVIITSLHIQPAPEIDSDILKSGAVDRFRGQVVGIGHIIGVVSLEIISVNVISAMA